MLDPIKHYIFKQPILSHTGLTMDCKKQLTPKSITTDYQTVVGKIRVMQSKPRTTRQIGARHPDDSIFHCKYKFSISTKSKFHHAYAFTSPDTILSLQIL